MELVSRTSSPITIRLGKTYRGKMPTLLSSVGTFNDRTIGGMSQDGSKLKFISAELKLGDVSKVMDTKFFENWARMEVPMHPLMSRHYQMMCYRQIKWREYGISDPKKPKKVQAQQ